MWNTSYENLLKFIEKYDKEYLKLFTIDAYLLSLKKTVDLIKALYKNNLSISWAEYKTFIKNVKINNTDKININTYTYNYDEISLLNKELELKVAYSKLKQKYHNTKLKNKNKNKEV